MIFYTSLVSQRYWVLVFTIVTTPPTSNLITLSPMDYLAIEPTGLLKRPASPLFRPRPSGQKLVERLHKCSFQFLNRKHIEIGRQPVPQKAHTPICRWDLVRLRWCCHIRQRYLVVGSCLSAEVRVGVPAGSLKRSCRLSLVAS